MLIRLACGTTLIAAMITWSASAIAQYGYDANCRPLPPPGYMMLPQPPSQACLQQRAAAARAAEAERQRQQAAADAEAAARQAQAEAAKKARQERLATEQAKCENATAADVQSTIGQDPVTFERFVKILDVTAPHFDSSNETCRSEVMTVRGIVYTLVTFQDFNGKQYLRVRIIGRD